MFLHSGAPALSSRDLVALSAPVGPWLPSPHWSIGTSGRMRSLATLLQQLKDAGGGLNGSTEITVSTTSSQADALSLGCKLLVLPPQDVRVLSSPGARASFTFYTDLEDVSGQLSQFVRKGGVVSGRHPSFTEPQPDHPKDFCRCW